VHVARPRRTIVDVVLGVQRPERHQPVVTAVVAALGACALLAIWMVRAQRGLEPSPAKPPRVPAQPTLEVELLVEPLPPASRRESLAAPQHRQPPAPRASRRTATSPAPAAAVVTQEPRPDVPVDLTSETFVTGTAKTPVGGATARAGTAMRPGPGSDVGAPPAPPTGSGALDRSSPVALANQSWSCPWPAEADALQIDEQMVVIRVVVRSDGGPESVAIVADPGHGFGAAASTCALHTRFAPARAPNGDPVRATSPPIRVRFTR